MSSAPVVGNSIQAADRAAGRSGSLMRRLLSAWKHAELSVPLSRSSWPTALRRTFWIGLLLVVVQAVVLGWWSVVLVNHFDLTMDFMAYNQATWLVANGHLTAPSTFVIGSFWRNDAEFFFALLAIPLRLWTSAATLKLLQVAALAGAQAVAWYWICEIAAKHSLRSGAKAVSVALAGLGLALIVLNPWVAWTASFDVHSEPFAALFLILAARDLLSGRWRRAWIWVVLTIMCGIAPVTYAIALGLSMLVMGRRWLGHGLAIAIVGLVWIMASRALGAGSGSSIGFLYPHLLQAAYGHVPANGSVGTLAVAILKRPDVAAQLMWSNRTNFWAVLSPPGVLGIWWPPALMITAVIFLQAGLTTGSVFSQPGFQNVVLVVLVAVGTIQALSWLHLRMRAWGRRGVVLLGGLLLANVVTWAAIWLPKVSTTWQLVPARSARVLTAVSKMIKPGDEVVAQQGVVGRFSARRYIYPLSTGRTTLPLKTKHVWFVFAPMLGAEPESPGEAAQNITQLGADRHARLVVDRDGVWAFEMTPPSSAKQIELGAGTSFFHSAAGRNGNLGTEVTTRASWTISGWTVAGAAGRAVRRGSRRNWHAAATGVRGYVVSGAYFLEPAGAYKLSVTLDASSPVRIEVWDSTSRELLGTKSIVHTSKRETVVVPADLKRVTTQKLFSGSGIWSVTRVSPPYGDNLEVRVWTPGGNAQVSVYSIAIR